MGQSNTKDLSAHDSHSTTKDVGEINKSSGLHVFELHAPSAGGGMLILLIVAAAVYAIYTLCNKHRRHHRRRQDSRDFERGMEMRSFSYPPRNPVNRYSYPAAAAYAIPPPPPITTPQMTWAEHLSELAGFRSSRPAHAPLECYEIPSTPSPMVHPQPATFPLMPTPAAIAAPSAPAPPPPQSSTPGSPNPSFHLSPSSRDAGDQTALSQ